jgi:hypothetical protein
MGELGVHKPLKIGSLRLVIQILGSASPNVNAIVACGCDNEALGTVTRMCVLAEQETWLYIAVHSFVNLAKV